MSGRSNWKFEDSIAAAASYELRQGSTLGILVVGD
jgi:hypothetical protein